MAVRWMLLAVITGCGGTVVSDPGSADATSEFNVDSWLPSERDTGPPFDAAFGDAPPTTIGCSECKQRHCDALACQVDPVCNKQRFCRQGCVDDACAAKCRELYPSALLDTFNECVAEHCAKACGL